METTDDYLLMSGIQHFCFCRRQWALIYLEQQWAENQRTAEGRLEHSRCHDDSKTEHRGELLITRGMRVVSHRLKLTGACDVVEFRSVPDGIPLQNQPGRWQPMPIEYKHGHPKENDADRLQLCAQAMALEEMLVCSISQGALFYEETRRRELVPLTDDLRQKTRQMADEMQQYFARGYTPKVKPGKHCNACSLKELCLPVLCRKADPKEYLRLHIDELTVQEDPSCENS